MQAKRVVETCLYADDLEKVEKFYGTVLGLELDSKVAGRHVFFRCGNSMVLVFNPHATSQQTSAIATHGSHGPGHAAFAMRPEEISSWREHLRQHGVSVEAEVDWPGGGHSLYFRDPAGNCLELVTPAIWGLPDEEGSSNDRQLSDS